MTLHELLAAASTVTHPHPAALTTAQVAATVGVGAVAALLLRGRHRLAGRAVPVPASGASPAAPALPPAPAPAPALTCRPQLQTPPGTARARDEVEQWLARGELDPETYGDLRLVFAQVEAATRD